MGEKNISQEIIHNIDKQDRIAELSPDKTLKKIGFVAEMSFCDIGAGTGLFTFVSGE